MLFLEAPNRPLKTRFREQELSSDGKIFYGWWIVLIGALGLCLGDGPIVVLTFGVFFKTLVRAFHVDRAAVSFAFTVHNIIVAFCVPLIGWLIDHMGARRVILAGTTLYALILLLSTTVGAHIAYLYLLFATLGVVAGSTSPVPYGTVISRWFDKRRGLALGLMAMGLGIGGVVMPLLAQHLIAAAGWRLAYASFGGAALIIAIPVVALFLKDTPEQRGLCRDGERFAPDSEQDARVDGLTWNETWHDGMFWLLLGAFFLAGASVFACALHLSALLTDRGMTPASAALATSLIGAAVFVGRIGAGYLLDRVFAPRIAMLFFSCAALGIVLLLAGSIGAVALIGAFLIGLGMGAEVDVIAYLMSRYFGLRSLGTAFGFGFGSFALSGAVGVFLMGEGFELTHSYSVPLAGCFIAEIIAIALMARLGPYRYSAPQAGGLTRGHSAVNRFEV
jgi:MFS family permease